MGPAVAPLIGISSLDWRRPIGPSVGAPSRFDVLGWDGAPGVPTKPQDHERYLRAELGTDWPLRIFRGGPTKGATPGHREPAREWGLFRRLARAVAGIF